MMSETEELVIPDYFKALIARVSNAHFAYQTNIVGKVFPLDLKQYLYPEGAWQNRVLAVLTRTMFRGTAVERVEGKCNAYALGYLAGLEESCLTPMTEANSDSKEFSESYVFKLLDSIDDDSLTQVEGAWNAHISKFTLQEQAEYSKGMAKGLTSVFSSEDELAYNSDSSEAYYLMLLYEEQLKHLETWAEFHRFIGDAIEGYAAASRFSACKKMGQMIGYSPKVEHGKKRAN